MTVEPSRAETEPSVDEAERELVISRVIDAPRDLVFKVWTDPAARWGGPRDFTTAATSMDFRPGGMFRTCMRSPKGKRYWARGVFREIEVPERLVFTWAWERDDGSLGHETVVTVTFIEDGDQTEISFHQALFESVAQRDSHADGWNEAIDRLAALVEGDHL